MLALPRALATSFCWLLSLPLLSQELRTFPLGEHGGRVELPDTWQRQRVPGWNEQAFVATDVGPDGLDWPT